MANLKNRFVGLEGKFELLETRVNARLDTFEQKIESKLKETIITNMKWTIGSIMLIVALLKILEIIFS